MERVRDRARVDCFRIPLEQHSDVIWPIVWAAVIVVEAVVISAPSTSWAVAGASVTRSGARAPAIPYRDLRQEYRHEP